MTQHVRCRRGRFLVQIRVPRDLRDHYPAQFVERYLGTSDKAEAKQRAPERVADILAEFKAKRQGPADAGTGLAALLHIRDVFRSQAFDDLAEGARFEDISGSGDVASALESMGVNLTRRDANLARFVASWGQALAHHRIETRAGPPPKPEPWRRPVTAGEMVESAVHLDEYLATLATRDKPVKAKTIDMKRSTIKKFCAEFPTLGEVSRQGVQRWMNRQAEADLASATIARNVSDVREFWRYLRSIQQVADDPDPFDSDKLSLAANGKNGRQDRRKPFTPGEVLKLLREAHAREDTELVDLIELGRWTGARREELCALKVDKVNLKGGYFEVEDAKTPAGWRQVPIHSRLRPVLRRLIGKRTDGYVLAGLSANKYDDLLQRQ